MRVDRLAVITFLASATIHDGPPSDAFVIPYPSQVIHHRSLSSSSSSSSSHQLSSSSSSSILLSRTQTQSITTTTTTQKKKKQNHPRSSSRSKTMSVLAMASSSVEETADEGAVVLSTSMDSSSSTSPDVSIAETETSSSSSSEASSSSPTTATTTSTPTSTSTPTPTINTNLSRTERTRLQLEQEIKDSEIVQAKIAQDIQEAQTKRTILEQQSMERKLKLLEINKQQRAKEELKERFIQMVVPSSIPSSTTTIIGTVVASISGLAIIRNILQSRESIRLEEERKRREEEERKRREEEEQQRIAKARRKQQQSNILLSTLGSVVLGAAISASDGNIIPTMIGSTSSSSDTSSSGSETTSSGPENDVDGGGGVIVARDGGPSTGSGGTVVGNNNNNNNNKNNVDDDGGGGRNTGAINMPYLEQRIQRAKERLFEKPQQQQQPDRGGESSMEEQQRGGGGQQQNRWLHLQPDGGGASMMKGERGGQNRWFGLKRSNKSTSSASSLAEQQKEIEERLKNKLLQQQQLLSSSSSDDDRREAERYDEEIAALQAQEERLKFEQEELEARQKVAREEEERLLAAAAKEEEERRLAAAAAAQAKEVEEKRLEQERLRAAQEAETAKQQERQRLADEEAVKLKKAADEARLLAEQEETARKEAEQEELRLRVDLEREEERLRQLEDQARAQAKEEEMERLRAAAEGLDFSDDNVGLSRTRSLSEIARRTAPSSPVPFVTGQEIPAAVESMKEKGSSILRDIFGEGEGRPARIATVGVLLTGAAAAAKASFDILTDKKDKRDKVRTDQTEDENRKGKSSPNFGNRIKTIQNDSRTDSSSRVTYDAPIVPDEKDMTSVNGSQRTSSLQPPPPPFSGSIADPTTPVTSTSSFKLPDYQPRKDVSSVQGSAKVNGDTITTDGKPVSSLKQPTGGFGIPGPTGKKSVPDPSTPFPPSIGGASVPPPPNVNQSLQGSPKQFPSPFGGGLAPPSQSNVNQSVPGSAKPFPSPNGGGSMPPPPNANQSVPTSPKPFSSSFRGGVATPPPNVNQSVPGPPKPFPLPNGGGSFPPPPNANQPVSDSSKPFSSSFGAPTKPAMSGPPTFARSGSRTSTSPDDMYRKLREDQVIEQRPQPGAGQQQSPTSTGNVAVSQVPPMGGISSSFAPSQGKTAPFPGTPKLSSLTDEKPGTSTLTSSASARGVASKDDMYAKLRQEQDEKMSLGGTKSSDDGAINQAASTDTTTAVTAPNGSPKKSSFSPFGRAPTTKASSTSAETTVVKPPQQRGQSMTTGSTTDSNKDMNSGNSMTISSYGQSPKRIETSSGKSDAVSSYGQISKGGPSQSFSPYGQVPKPRSSGTSTPLVPNAGTSESKSGQVPKPEAPTSYSPFGQAPKPKGGEVNNLSGPNASSPAMNSGNPTTAPSYGQVPKPEAQKSYSPFGQVPKPRATGISNPSNPNPALSVPGGPKTPNPVETDSVNPKPIPSFGQVPKPEAQKSYSPFGQVPKPKAATTPSFQNAPGSGSKELSDATVDKSVTPRSTYGVPPTSTAQPIRNYSAKAFETATSSGWQKEPKTERKDDDTTDQVLEGVEASRMAEANRRAERKLSRDEEAAALKERDRLRKLAEARAKVMAIIESGNSNVSSESNGKSGGSETTSSIQSDRSSDTDTSVLESARLVQIDNNVPNSSPASTMARPKDGEAMGNMGVTREQVRQAEGDLPQDDKQNNSLPPKSNFPLSPPPSLTFSSKSTSSVTSRKEEGDENQRTVKMDSVATPPEQNSSKATPGLSFSPYGQSSKLTPVPSSETGFIAPPSSTSTPAPSVGNDTVDEMMKTPLERQKSQEKELESELSKKSSTERQLGIDERKAKEVEATNFRYSPSDQGSESSRASPFQPKSDGAAGAASLSSSNGTPETVITPFAASSFAPIRQGTTRSRNDETRIWSAEQLLSDEQPKSRAERVRSRFEDQSRYGGLSQVGPIAGGSENSSYGLQRREESDQDMSLTNTILGTDEGYVPSPKALEDERVATLLQEVDGTPMNEFQNNESLYTGRSVRVFGESSLTVPVRISTPGSIVEYTIEKKTYDFFFGITTRVGQSQVMVVKNLLPFDERIQGSPVQQPKRKVVTDRLLVGAGSAPSVMTFTFENRNSWTLEMTYQIRVIPPPIETAIAGRRLRAQAGVRFIDSDLQKLDARLGVASSERDALEKEITELNQAIQNLDRSLRNAKEREWSSKVQYEAGRDEGIQ